MTKLTLPKNPINGLKIFCKKCRQNNTGCKHYEDQYYRLMVHIPGSKGNTKSKILKSRTYEDAVIESINFKKSLSSNQYEDNESFEMTLLNSFILYNRYINGEHEIKQYQKPLNTPEYIKEQVRVLKEFIKKIQEFRQRSSNEILISDINKEDVSHYYEYCENKFQPKTFNKRITELKRFFQYLIDCEDVEMKNPFNNVVKKKLIKREPKVINMDDFSRIIDSIETTDPFKKVGKEIKNMYRPYLKNGFLLLLYTGGRFEDVVNMKWNDIRKEGETEYFYVKNHKVNRLKKLKGINKEENEELSYKRFTIFPEFMDLLIELGYEENKGEDMYVLHPQDDVNRKTLSTQLSKSFSHYRDNAGISEDISLKNLRKTHITKLYEIVKEDTRLVTDHTTDKVLREHYVDKQTLNTQEKIKTNLRFLG
jgi:integrase